MVFAAGTRSFSRSDFPLSSPDHRREAQVIRRPRCPLVTAKSGLRTVALPGWRAPCAGGCQFAPLLCGLFPPPLAACSAKRDRPLQVGSRRQRRALVVSPSAFLKPRRSPPLSRNHIRPLPLRPFDWQWYGRRQALSSGKSALASLLLFPPPHSKNAAHRLFPHSMGATPPPTVTHLAIVLASPSPFSRLTAAPHQRKPTLFNLPCPAIAFTLSPSGRLTGSGIMGVAKPSQVGNRHRPPFCCFPLRILKTRPIGYFPTAWGQLLIPPSPILQLRWLSLPPSAVWQRHRTREKPTLSNLPCPAITSAFPPPSQPLDRQMLRDFAISIKQAMADRVPVSVPFVIESPSSNQPFPLQGHPLVWLPPRCV